MDRVYLCDREGFAEQDRAALFRESGGGGGRYCMYHCCTLPDVRKAVEEKADVIKAYVVGDDLKEIDLRLGDLTDAERQIILDGCLINYYKSEM